MDRVSMFWDGPYDYAIQKCISSFSRWHNVYVYSYQEQEFCDCINCDAESIVKYNPKFDNIKFFADWFRINLIYKVGGWWSDCDNYCLKPLDFDTKNIFTYFRKDEGLLNNSIFKCHKNSTLLLQVLNAYTDNVHIPGQLIFDGILRNNNALYLDSNILHANINEITDNTRVVHMFNSGLKSNINLIDKIAIYS